MSPFDREDVQDVFVQDEHIAICSCGVIVLWFKFGFDEVFRFDPTFLQRRWVRSLVPRSIWTVHGFGWSVGREHVCCSEGNRPIDVAARMAAPRSGMGLAGDGTFEGPAGQGGDS